MTFCDLAIYIDNPLLTLYRTRPFTEFWVVSIEHLRRVWHADRGRLLLRTPGPVPLGLAYVLLVETNPFPNLSLFYGTMLFEYPSVLSRFCILHNCNKDIIKAHDYGYFAILGENVFFEQKQFHLLKLLVIYRNKSNNGYRKQSLKIWSWFDHFTGFYRYLKFKIQRKKSVWCETFLKSILSWKYDPRSIWLCEVEKQQLVENLAKTSIKVLHYSVHLLRCVW